MIVYRVIHLTDEGSSAGFSWHLKKSDAKAAAIKSADDNGRDEPVQIERHLIHVTKEGVMRALAYFASEPHNG